MNRFVRECGVSSETRILDVGGTPETWRIEGIKPRVVLLNMPRARDEVAGAIAWVAGDGCALPFGDQCFDLVFSNSVIEHVGDEASQRAFAREVERVGRGYWVQTPNLRFPVEQHLLTPLIHWLPRPWQRRIVPRFSIWRLVARVTPEQRDFYLKHYLEDVRLLTAGGLEALFPGADLIRERVCGLTKSLIAYKRP